MPLRNFTSENFSVLHSEQESAGKNIEAKKLEQTIYFFTEIELQNK